MTSLAALGCLSTIEGHLRIQEANQLESLEGLGALGTIGGDLDLVHCVDQDDYPYTRCFGNTALRDLRGLEQLTYIGGNIRIGYSETLESLTGLEGLGAVGWGIELTSNPHLGSVEALRRLKQVRGELHIESNQELTSLEGLQNVEQIGALVLLNDGLTSLEGLRGLKWVDDTVTLSRNGSLRDLHGLEALEHIGGDLELGACYATEPEEPVYSFDCFGNYELVDVDPLMNLTTLGGNLTIGGNGKLDSLAGLANVSANLSATEADVTIWGNPALTHLDGLGGLYGIAGQVTIVRNDTLTSVAGLAGLSSISESLTVRENAALLSFDAFREPGGTLSGSVDISENPALTRVATLDGVSSVVGWLGVEWNDSLVEFSGLGATEVSTAPGAYIYFSQNPLLSNVSGLSHLTRTRGLNFYATGLVNLDDLGALTRVEGYLQLEQNPLLQNLRGLASLEYVENFGVIGNASLPDCEAEWLCSLVPSAICAHDHNDGDVGSCP